jgi:hypothetical protein
VIEGVATSSAASVDPLRAVWANVLDNLFESARHASKAEETGSAKTTPKTSDAQQPSDAQQNTSDTQRTAALTLLRDDVAQFKKLHTR